MKPEIKQRIEQINNGIVPDGYKKTEFGVFSCDWVEKKLSDLFDFKNGVNADKDKYDSGIKMISVMDILSERPIVYDSIIGQVDIDAKTLREYDVNYGDILFQRSSETFEDAGKSNVYLDSKIATYSGFVIRGKKKSHNNPYYINESLKCGYSRKQITRSAAGSQHINVGQESLEKVAVLLPSINEQERIAEILMKWDEAIELQEKYIETLEEKKKAITHNLMSPKESWNIAKLSDIVEKKKGCIVHYNENGKYPVIDMNCFLSGNFSCFTNDTGVTAAENDILVLWDGAGAGSVLTGVVGIVGSTFAKLSIKTDKIDNIFLSLWLTKENDANLAKREGSGIPHMPKDYIKYQRVCFPELAEQKRISNAINRIQEEIKLKSLLLEKLKQQRKALQQYLLNGIVRVF